MKLLGSAKKDVDKDKDGEDVSTLESVFRQSSICFDS